MCRKDDAKKKSSKEVWPTPKRGSWLLKKNNMSTKQYYIVNIFYANLVPGQSILTCLTLKTGGHFV